MCVGGGGGGAAAPAMNRDDAVPDPSGLGRDLVKGEDGGTRLRDGVSHSVHSGAMADKAKTNRDQMKAWSTGSNPKAYAKGKQSDKFG